MRKRADESYLRFAKAILQQKHAQKRSQAIAHISDKEIQPSQKICSTHQRAFVNLKVFLRLAKFLSLFACPCFDGFALWLNLSKKRPFFIKLALFVIITHARFICLATLCKVFQPFLALVRCEILARRFCFCLGLARFDKFVRASLLLAFHRFELWRGRISLV